MATQEYGEPFPDCEDLLHRNRDRVAANDRVNLVHHLVESDPTETDPTAPINSADPIAIAAVNPLAAASEPNAASELNAVIDPKEAGDPKETIETTRERSGFILNDPATWSTPHRSAPEWRSDSTRSASTPSTTC